MREPIIHDLNGLLHGRCVEVVRASSLLHGELARVVDEEEGGGGGSGRWRWARQGWRWVGRWYDADLDLF